MNPLLAITPSSRQRAALAALLVAYLISACHRDAMPVAAAPAPSAPTTAPVEATASNPARTEVPAPAPGETAASDTPAPTPAQGVFILAPSQSVTIAPATTLTFERIVNDSRCPAGVQCVWAGEVRIALALASPAGSASFEMASMSAPHASVQAMAFEWLAFAACPASQAGGQAAAECVSVQVGKGPLR